MANPSLNPKRTNHMQDQVFGKHPRAQLIVNPKATDLEFVHRQALTCQHITNLRRADTKGDRPKGTVC